MRVFLLHYCDSSCATIGDFIYWPKTLSDRRAEDEKGTKRWNLQSLMATRNPRKLTSWGNGCLSQYFLGGFIHLDNLMINALTWMFQPFWVGSSRTKLPFGVTTNDGKGLEKNCPESCMTGSAVSSSHDSLASLAFIFIHQNFVHIFGAALNSTCCSNIVCIMSLKIQHDSTNIHHNFSAKSVHLPKT